MAPPIPERDTLSVPPDGRPLSEQPAWRQDFPIDWPQDEYVERRDFVKFLTLTSPAFVAGQFWIAGKQWLRGRELAPGAKRIAAVTDLAVGGSLVFHYPASTTRACWSGSRNRSSWRSGRNARTCRAR